MLIKKEIFKFKKWTGAPIRNNYGGKAVINYGGEPLFAELTVLRIWQARGWQGVWVDTYKKRFHTDLPEKNPGIKLPEEKLKLLQKISKSLSGCWDVFLWKGSEILFIELKRIKKDKIRGSQIKFYKTALEIGTKKKSFFVVEWDIIKNK